MNFLLVPQLTCVAICIVGAVTDVRTGRIPNWLTGSGALCGLVLNPVCALLGLQDGQDATLALLSGLMTAVVGCLLLLLVFGLMGLMRFLRWGDVKLAAAVGALLGWPDALWALAYITLVGGVVAALYALFRGKLRRVLHNLYSLGRGAVQPSTSGTKVELTTFPYGVAILLGTVWTVAAHHLPALRLGG